MPTHSLCVAFPLASTPSTVTFVLNGKAISYLTVLLRFIPRPTWDFFAFSFQVPSNALPKQSAPAASQTVRAIKVVLDFMAQMKTGFGRYVNAFVLLTTDYTDVSDWGATSRRRELFATFNSQLSTLSQLVTGHVSL